MKFIERELNAGIVLEFGDFVLFNGGEVAIVSYNNEENCCLTFLTNGYVRRYEINDLEEFATFLLESYKGIRFIKENDIVINEM